MGMREWWGIQFFAGGKRSTSQVTLVEVGSIYHMGDIWQRR
jgi:hypothetical protein